MDPRVKPGGDAAASGNDSRFAAVLRRSTERAFEIRANCRVVIGARPTISRIGWVFSWENAPL